jgi:hypothetical protein
MLTRIPTLLAVLATIPTAAAEPPKRTSLSDPAVRYTVPDKPYVVLTRRDVRAVVVDNQPVDDAVLPKHRAGYSGVGSLTHAKRKTNLFVPEVAGLNFEHILDGTTRDRKVLFEPRNAPMELRRVGEHVAELYQKPTPTWGLESCQRYELLEDGTIQLTIDCIPRQKAFKNGYVGLFWASYIHQPESLDIHFRGYDEADVGTDGKPKREARWVRGVTPKHGELPTHLATDDARRPHHDADFPLTLVFNRSKLRYAEPWYFGVSHGMAYAQMFRPGDGVRLSQSPSGGGKGNPAWDFQFLIPDYEIGRRYQFVMRAMYLPFESAEQVERATRPHREALRRDPAH